MNFSIKAGSNKALHALNATKQSPDPNIDIWQCEVNQNIQSYLHNWIGFTKPDLKAKIQVAQTQKVLSEICSKLAADSPVMQAVFLEEFSTLCSLFFQETQEKELSFQLQIVRDNLCRRWHADYNKHRLLCTYIGAGSLWTTHKNVDWEEDHVNGLKNPHMIFQAQPFEILLLKGRLHPKAQGRGLIHRSPEVSPEHPVRILLKLNAV